MLGSDQGIRFKDRLCCKILCYVTNSFALCLSRLCLFGWKAKATQPLSTGATPRLASLEPRPIDQVISHQHHGSWTPKVVLPTPPQNPYLSLCPHSTFYYSPKLQLCLLSLAANLLTARILVAIAAIAKRSHQKQV